jgi:uncharacterized protein YjbI with pentapeptide repeats
VFDGATFKLVAGFDGATFLKVARFNGVAFQGDAIFEGATFKHRAQFDRVTFQDVAAFDRATFQRDAGFGGARFEQARQLGPVLVYGVLRLDAAHFAQLVQIEASTRGLSCRRTRFPAGVQFRLRGAQIVLDDADLPSPSLLVGIPALSDAQLARREQRLVQAVRRLAPQAAVELSERPRLLSIQGANAAGLTISNVDLADCRFAGAHNLDRLRLETKVTFSAAPVRLPWDWRQVIAEERAWRAARSKRWTRPQSPPGWLNKPYGSEWPEKVPAGQIAGLYRALRKGREDAKDEPGAADFYYGEMEMRRHAGSPSDNDTGEASRGQIERAVLTAYWLASGYGLRAWRALAALTVVLVAFAGLLVWKGYEDAAGSGDAPPASTSAAHPGSSSSTAAPARPAAGSAPTTTAPASPAGSVADQSLVGSLLYGARTIIGLNPTPAPVLTRFGEVLLIAVRLLGPLLLGLALLALRGRVKR